MGKLNTKQKQLTFGLQRDMNGLTNHIEAVPQRERKAQASDIQTTQSIFGSFQL